MLRKADSNYRPLDYDSNEIPLLYYAINKHTHFFSANICIKNVVATINKAFTIGTKLKHLI